MPERRPNRPPYLHEIIVGVLLIATIVWAFAIRPRLDRQKVTDLKLTHAANLIRRDEFDKAVELLSEARENDPKNKAAERELLKARIFRIGAKYDRNNAKYDFEEIAKAQAELELLLAEDRRNAELLALRGIISALTDRPTEAIEMYNQAMELDSQYPNVRNYWGYTLIQWEYSKTWKEDAAEKFNEAIHLDKNYSTPQRNLALLLIKDSKYRDASNILSDAEANARDDAEFYVLWGNCMLLWGHQLRGTDEATENYFEALNKFRIAEVLDPKLPSLYVNRGVVLRSLGRDDSAINEYETAINLEPDLQYARENLADLLYSKNEFAKALFQYNEALRIVNNRIKQFQTRKENTPDAVAKERLSQSIEMAKKEKKDLEAHIHEMAQRVGAGR